MTRIYDPEPRFPLTADVIARAIVASARSYGDDPVRAFGGGSRRRCLTAAVVGLHEATGATVKRVASVLDVEIKNVYTARRIGQPAFIKAAAAAKEATLYNERMAELQAKAPAVPLPSSPTPAPSIVAQNRDIPGSAPAQPERPLQQNPKSETIPQRKPQPGEQYRTGRRARAFSKSATFKSLGDGVQVIRLKPIDDKVLDRARRTIGPRCTLETFADLWDVDAEALQRALQPEVTA